MEDEDKETVESERPLTITELLAEVRRLGPKTLAETADIIRADRDRRADR